MESWRWQRGETVVMRFPLEERMVRAYRATHQDLAANVMGLPSVVLEDTDARLALYMPEASPIQRWNIEEGVFRPLGGAGSNARASHGDSVRLFFPGSEFEVSLFYETGSGPAPHVAYYFPGVSGRFYGWKIDLCSPYARTPAGVDLIDEVLDIVVTPERKCDWRDLDENGASRQPRHL